MRYIGIQLLTWGTIAGTVGSVLVLAALDSPLEAKLAALPRAAWATATDVAQPASSGGHTADKPADRAAPTAPPSADRARPTQR